MNTATELGQFSPSGESPYVRYSLAGGSGYVDELYGKLVINLNGGTTLDLPPACMEFSHLERPTSANIQGIVLRLARAFECKTNESTVGAAVLTEGTSVGISVGVMAGGLRENANGGTNPVITLVVVEDVVRDKLEHVNAFPATASLRTTGSVSFSADVPAGFRFTGAHWEYEVPLPVSVVGASQRNTDHPVTHQDIFDKATKNLQPGQVASADVRGSHISMPLEFYNGAGIYTLVVFVVPDVADGYLQLSKVTARSIIVRR